VPPGGLPRGLDSVIALRTTGNAQKTQEEIAMLDFFRKAALAGIGALTLTEERARKIVEELVEQGRVSRDEGETLIKDMMAKADTSRTEWEGRIREMVQEAFRKMDLVPRRDLQVLEEQLRILERRVAELEHRERELEEQMPTGE
jgi:polyhydroxyalkanoate synthesis regulator phasin